MTRSARISLLQLPAFSLEEAEASLAHTLRRIDDAARERPDIIALPEVTYPAYFLGRRDISGCGVLSPAEALDVFAGKARQHGVYIAAGLAIEAEGAGYANGAVLFGRDGAVIGRYSKSFLYHFDTRWFTAGSAYPVFETDAGRIGMLVCADGRLPEIARSLVLNGAQIILDLTAWVSSGRAEADLTSTQREYLMRARAAENGVWVGVADKYGVEAESIVYCGRSCVIDPRGNVVATLGPYEDAILTCDVPIEDAAPIFERRPSLYETLTQPTPSLPVTRQLTEPLVIGDESHRVAAVQVAMPPRGDEFLALARSYVERLALQDAEVVVFPATPVRFQAAYDPGVVLAEIEKLARATKTCIAFTMLELEQDRRYHTMFLAGPRGLLAKHRLTHHGMDTYDTGTTLGDDVCPVVTTPVGKVGLLLGAEGFVPEVARSLMLRGAELLLWSAGHPPLPMHMFARTRAEENRVYVACAGGPTANGAATIADPTGRVLGAALEGRELAVSAGINRALARWKEVAPGTDVVRDRQPAAYGALTRASAPASAAVAGA